MTCRLRWYGRRRNRKFNSNMADVWANSVACHPRATCHIAGWKNSNRHIENRFSPYFIFFCFRNAVWALASSSFHIVFDTLAVKSKSSWCASIYQLLALMSCFASKVFESGPEGLLPTINADTELSVGLLGLRVFCFPATLQPNEFILCLEARLICFDKRTIRNEAVA